MKQTAEPCHARPRGLPGNPLTQGRGSHDAFLPDAPAWEDSAPESVAAAVS